MEPVAAPVASRSVSDCPLRTLVGGTSALQALEPTVQFAPGAAQAPALASAQEGVPVWLSVPLLQA